MRLIGRFAVAAVVVLGSAAVAAGSAQAASPGSVDPSFRYVRTFPGEVATEKGSYVAGGGLAIGPEDSIYTLLEVSTCPEGEGRCEVAIRVVRRFSDGSLDTSFGFGGATESVTLPESRGATRGDSIAVGPAGLPVVAAEREGQVELIRWGADGRLDPGFGSGGIVDADFGVFESRPKLAVRPDESVVLAVSTGEAPPGGLILARYRADGSLDPRFAGEPRKVGGPGWVSLGGPSGGFGMSVSNRGAIAVAGPRCCDLSSTSAFADLRRSDGTRRPPRTARSPLFRYRFGAEVSVGSVVALPNGKVYLVGIRNERGFAAKILPDGRLDRSYGRHRGWVRLGAIQAIRGMPPVAAVDDQGRLLVAGTSLGESELGGGETFVVRRNPGGRVDPSWGEGSPVALSRVVPIAANAPLGVALQSSGQIVLFGTNGTECYRICVPPRLSMVRLVGGPNVIRRSRGRHRHQ